MFAFKDVGGCWSFLMNNRCCYSDCTPHQFRNGKESKLEAKTLAKLFFHKVSCFKLLTHPLLYNLNHWASVLAVKTNTIAHSGSAPSCGGTSWVIIIKRLKWHQNCCCHQQMWCHVCEHKSSHSRSAASAYIYLCYNHQTEILRWRQCCDSNTLVARGAYFIEMCC